MTSPDLTLANIDKIADLFPTVVTETLDADGEPTRAIDFDLLRQELSDHIIEGPRERYQLDWPGKRAAALAANAPIAKTLRPARSESVDFDTTRNLFIEGDNLEALKLLQESYLGKVKLIYIDPPYNTGNDFVYADDFAETSAEYLLRSGQNSGSGDRLVSNTEANGRFHSDWLSMMYPRLKLARFLEVNGLLRHPDYRDIPLSLDDCGDLASELGEPDAWAVAARFASEILPGVFRLTDPAVRVRFAAEHRSALERLLLDIPSEVFTTEDALGWVYQFWQTAEKKRVNESGVKIGGADLSPVTQLFTENYMVRFLLENSLGAWWAARHPESALLDGWEYLRRNEDGTPAAGSFSDWPDRAADVTVMDPAFMRKSDVSRDTLPVSRRWPGKAREVRKLARASRHFQLAPAGCGS